MGIAPPEQEPGESDEAYYERMRVFWAGVYHDRELADGPHPAGPTVGKCESCGLKADQFQIRHVANEQHGTYELPAWVLLEPPERLESDGWKEAHLVPPDFRWMVDDMVAYRLHRKAPEPVDTCRVAHRLVCPVTGPPDPWSWVAEVREANRLLMQTPPDETGE